MADVTPDDIYARIVGEYEAIAKALTLEVTAELIENCPVKTGHARANFIPFAGEDPQTEAQTTAEQQAGIQQVLAWKLGDGDLGVSNVVPYIDRLIAGSSSQSPPGWDLVAVDTAVASIQAQYDGVQIDVSTGGAVQFRGAAAAGNIAAAFSPLEDM